MTQQPTVLVLGASRGLGFALTKEWLERGWRVIATVRTPSVELTDLGALESQWNARRCGRDVGVGCFLMTQHLSRGQDIAIDGGFTIGGPRM